MKNICFIILSLLFIGSCTEKKQQWQLADTINLGSVTPIGFVFQGDQIWISDGDHNQLVAIDSKGAIQQTFTDFERPMHLDTDGSAIFIPVYGADQIIKFSNGKRSTVEVADSLDAPAGVSVSAQEIAIADFYNHRVLFYDGTDWIAFGKEGKAMGELFYPTDVQLLSDKIVVADAYNNRIQVFDKKGNALQVIGEGEKMNATTGIYADQDFIYATDFENDRVLIFQSNGDLFQIIEEGIASPTDILINDGRLYIANYEGKDILKFEKH